MSAVRALFLKISVQDADAGQRKDMNDPEEIYRLLAQKHGFESSQTYLRVLRFLITPVQARIAAGLPGDAGEIAARTNLDLSLVRTNLEELLRKGVVVPRDYSNPDYFIFCKYAERLWEVSESLEGLDIYTEDEKRQLFFLWEDWKKTDYADMTARRWHDLKRMGINGLRIVPACKAVKDLPGLLPYEDPREIIKAQPLITVVSCSCRKHKKMIGDPCKKSDSDANCLQFARSAEYSLIRGHGRRISVDEALHIADRNEDEGLVHQWMNTARVEAAQPYALCSCCRCCCTVWHAADIRDVPNDEVFAKSRFEARVDTSLCNGCQDCIDRCQFDAIDMVKVEGERKLKAGVDPEKCWGCGVCTIACPTGALTMHTVRPPEHIPA
ncbi:MAG: 4Fe-4S binding protein [Dehalococcoidia bacterium]|nr:4Fe-4S binding protein [Dehalococcoidia bacterium]